MFRGLGFGVWGSADCCLPLEDPWAALWLGLLFDNRGDHTCLYADGQMGVCRGRPGTRPLLGTSTSAGGGRITTATAGSRSVP